MTTKIKNRFLGIRFDEEDLARLHEVSLIQSIPMATLVRKVVREQLLYPQTKTPSESLDNF